jgi:4,5-DOPA dioxygenase extradiol
MSKNNIMPVLFIGHGNPLNAIENNEFSKGWEDIAKEIPHPDSILCISAHWETWGPMVTASDKPETIHDFGGFPEALYRVKYPAAGSTKLANQVKKAIKSCKVTADNERGLDHGCWSVLKRMYPKADVPVVQLSLDQALSGPEHYKMAKELASLREEGVLIIGSGNIVHNLYLVELHGEDFNEEFGFDWAIKANDLVKKLIVNEEFEKLADYKSLGKAINLAAPTPEHFLPVLYPLALKRKGEEIMFFNDRAIAGSLTMTSFIIR